MCAISVDFSSANLKVAGGFNNPARKLCEFHETIEHCISSRFDFGNRAATGKNGSS